MVKRSTWRWQALQGEFGQPMHLAEFVAGECPEAIGQERALLGFQSRDKVISRFSEPDAIGGTLGLPAHESCRCQLGHQHGYVAGGHPEVFAELALGAPGTIADRQQ